MSRQHLPLRYSQHRFFRVLGLVEILNMYEGLSRKNIPKIETLPEKGVILLDI